MAQMFTAIKQIFTIMKYCWYSLKSGN